MAAFFAKLRLVLAELARPSAQREDWFAWAAGQMALLLYARRIVAEHFPKARRVRFERRKGDAVRQVDLAL